jgi:periplasmic protein TonB
LQGKLVLEITISPAGDVTNVRVVSSELKDPELERKIAARVRLFRFEAKDVETITANKPIDFFPA